MAVGVCHDSYNLDVALIFWEDYNFIYFLFLHAQKYKFINIYLMMHVLQKVSLGRKHVPKDDKTTMHWFIGIYEFRNLYNFFIRVSNKQGNSCWLNTQCLPHVFSVRRRSIIEVSITALSNNTESTDI